MCGFHPVNRRAVVVMRAAGLKPTGGNKGNRIDSTTPSQ